MTQVTKEQFIEMVNTHDLTYAYSDDGGVYRAGSRSEMKIREAAKSFDKEFVNKVWNEMVDKFLAEGYREPFYDLIR